MLPLVTFALIAVAIAFPGLIALVMSRVIDTRNRTERFSMTKSLRYLANSSRAATPSTRLAGVEDDSDAEVRGTEAR